MRRHLLLITFCCLWLGAASQAATELADVRAVRRPGTPWVDVHYSWGADLLPQVSAPDSGWVVLEASADGGATWDLPVISVAGDAGRTAAGDGHMVWYMGADISPALFDVCTIRVLVSAEPSVPSGHDMIRVAAGDFSMGTDAGDSQEGPVHLVTLDAYWIDRYETTNRCFQRFVQSTGFQTLAEREGQSVIYLDGGYHTVEGASWWRPSGAGSELTGRLDHPVVQIAWDDADAYCRWAGKRLPTEAQWERAARGTDQRTYPWGESGSHTPVPMANAGSENCCHESAHDGYRNTAPVGSFPQGVSPTGALDMAGNVWEWTKDRYYGYFYADSPHNNPTGPASGDERVLRGGSWISYPFMLRTVYRGHHTPETRHNYSGFRCVRDDH
ncbi:MAG: formylglycine-generating enzyme family protein [bacterium]|nr:formylglycine-generating enzyme family protein [bacterium]